MKLPLSLLLLAIIYAAFISLGLPDSLLGATWPAMYKALAVPLHRAGAISMIISGGTVVSSLISVRVIRRFGTAPVTLASVCLTALALLGFSVSRALPALCLCAVPLGLGGGSIDAALNNYVALRYKARHMNWLHCFWGIGASTGPLITAAFLSAGKPWYYGYRTVGCVQLGLAALLAVSLPLWKRAGGANAASAGGAAAKVTIPLSRVPGLPCALAAFLCYCAIESICGIWGATFMVTVKGTEPETAARWIACYFGGITFGRFLSGFLASRLSNRNMVRAGQGVMALGIALLLAPPRLGAFIPFFVTGLGCAPVFPSLLHETPENFGAERSQAVMGTQMAAAYIGTTLAPPLFGRAASAAGFRLLPLCTACLLIIKVILTERLNRTRQPL